MGMNVGSSSGGDAEPIMDINTTPLIDVMLVLLVMLIITIPIQLHTVNLNMPIGNPPQTDLKPAKVQIDIDEKSVVYWDGVPVSDRADLEFKMAEAAKLPNNSKNKLLFGVPENGPSSMIPEAN